MPGMIGALMFYDAPLHEGRPPREAGEETQSAVYAAAAASRECAAAAGAVPA